MGYLCGLGTFGLSKGLITAAGISGRMTSVIIDAELPADIRPYSGIYDYCDRCGECIARCPAAAIDENGKKHPPCFQWLLYTKQTYPPRIGCGKCQVGVPCESGIPHRESVLGN